MWQTNERNDTNSGNYAFFEQQLNENIVSKLGLRKVKHD
jgi:hypothetical protein